VRIFIPEKIVNFAGIIAAGSWSGGYTVNKSII